MVTYFVLNASSARAISTWERLVPVLEGKKVPYRVSAADGCSIEALVVSLARHGAREIIAVGGDGTANAVLNGILSSGVDPREFTIGTIPAGSANDWARSIGVPLDPTRALSIILEGRIIRQSVGKVMGCGGRTRYFLNLTGIGLDAEAVKIKTPSPLPYAMGTITSFMKFKILTTFVWGDGKLVFEGPALSASAGIGRYGAGGIVKFPHADLDGNFLAGLVISPKGILRFRARKMEVEVHGGTYWCEVDGERFWHSPLILERTDIRISVFGGGMRGSRKLSCCTSCPA